MIVKREISLCEFEAWSGAVDTLDYIVREGGDRNLEAALEDMYPEGIDETQLNDILWFEPEWCFEVAGVGNPDESDDEEGEE